MRLTGIATLFALLFCAPVSAQGPAPGQYPYGLDPYKPSDAELLRKFGSVLVAQTPLLEMKKLDPYKPSEAALLRELGRAIPLWALSYPPGPVPVSLTPFSGTNGSASLPPNVNVFIIGQLPAGNAPASTRPAAMPSPPTATATTLRPESNDGVWISYEGERWISRGAAIPFDASRFVRAGNYESFPVFRRRGTSEEVIYLPTREGLVAPYRLKR